MTSSTSPSDHWGGSAHAGLDNPIHFVGGSGATFGADMSVAPEPYRTCGHTGYFQKSLRNHISIHTRSIYICYIILSHIVYYSVLYHIVLYYKGSPEARVPSPRPCRTRTSSKQWAFGSCKAPLLMHFGHGRLKVSEAWRHRIAYMLSERCAQLQR